MTGPSNLHGEHDKLTIMDLVMTRTIENDNPEVRLEQGKKMLKFRNDQLLPDTLQNMDPDIAFEVLINEKKFCTSEVKQRLKAVKNLRYKLKDGKIKRNNVKRVENVIEKSMSQLYVWVLNDMGDMITIKHGLDLLIRPVNMHYQGMIELDAELEPDVVVTGFYVRFMNDLENICSIRNKLGVLAEVFARCILESKKDSMNKHNNKLSQKEVINSAFLLALGNGTTSLDIEVLFGEPPVLVFYYTCFQRGETYQIEPKVKETFFMYHYCLSVVYIDTKMLLIYYGGELPEDLLTLIKKVNELNKQSSMADFRYFLQVERWEYLKLAYSNLKGRQPDNDLRLQFNSAYDICQRLIANVTYSQ